MREDMVDRAIEAVADGLPIDWKRLEDGAPSEDARERLHCVRILGQIAELHRSTDDPFEAPGQEPAARRPGASRSAPEAEAEVWGRYRLAEKVGEGSYGSVYRALDPELEWDIAIKILHRHVADSRLKEQLLREGRALAKVRHPNVVSVLGVESHEDRVGLCMEFVRGDTLEELLRTRGSFNSREAAAIGEDVCRALSAVHLAGFVHRDVKARNVMRDRNGRIVLMDFGTGREARPGQSAGAADLAGTPLYMAPEVLAGEAASACSDVYSVGVLLYHLVTSEYPVVAYSVDDIRVAHVQAKRSPLGETRPDLPARFVRVVERALAKAPADRYPSAEAMLNGLAAVFGDRWTVRAIAKKLLAMVLAVTVAAGIATALGWFSARNFNVALERSEFASEKLGDWLTLGMRSSVLAIGLITVASLATALLLVVRRLALGLSPAAARLDDAARAFLAKAAHRLRLYDLSALASWILLLSISALIWAWWSFWPLIDSASSSISTAPAEVLARLSPANQEQQENYRLAFGCLGMSMVAAWYIAFTVAGRRGQTLNRGLVAGGIATIVLTFASFVLPYPLIMRDNMFKAVTWRNADCYLLGERAGDVLLFCPALPPPRARVLQKGAERLERLDRRENIFTSFSSALNATK